MNLIRIQNNNKLMTALLLRDKFDDFDLILLELRHGYFMTIDGSFTNSLSNVQNEEARQEVSNQVLDEYTKWKSIRPLLYEHIKGNKPPQSLKIILRISSNKEKDILSAFSETISSSINSFILTITYENNLIKLTTATNYKSFLLDKSAENAYDQYILNFLESLAIDFEY